MSKKGISHKFSRVHNEINSRKNFFYYQCFLPNKHGCINWSGNKNKKGYGTIYWHDKKMQLAHRVSYEIHFGKFNPELCVLHKCDNPSCVAPNHLFLGTKADNMQDCLNKGRLKIPKLKGDNHYKSKILDCEIEIVKAKLDFGVSARYLAEYYDVHPDTIYAIKNNKNRKVA